MFIQHRPRTSHGCLRDLAHLGKCQRSWDPASINYSTCPLRSLFYFPPIWQATSLCYIFRSGYNPQSLLEKTSGLSLDDYTARLTFLSFSLEGVPSVHPVEHLWLAIRCSRATIHTHSHSPFTVYHIWPLNFEHINVLYPSYKSKSPLEPCWLLYFHNSIYLSNISLSLLSYHDGMVSIQRPPKHFRHAWSRPGF